MVISRDPTEFANMRAALDPSDLSAFAELFELVGGVSDGTVSGSHHHFLSDCTTGFAYDAVRPGAGHESPRTHNGPRTQTDR
jgi:hypothetical protein